MAAELKQTSYDRFRPPLEEPVLPAYDHEVERDFAPGGFVEEQLANQIKTYGRDPAEHRGAERAQYLRDMTLACTEELHEILRENSWKPWHHGRPGYGEVARAIPDKALKRMIEDEFGDVMCFLGNLARAHGLTTEDVIAGHRRKLLENSIRHADQAKLEA
jgi:hypothetical protein